jgi:hypothetical protein
MDKESRRLLEKEEMEECQLPAVANGLAMGLSNPN